MLFPPPASTRSDWNLRLPSTSMYPLLSFIPHFLNKERGQRSQRKFSYSPWPWTSGGKRNTSTPISASTTRCLEFAKLCLQISQCPFHQTPAAIRHKLCNITIWLATVKTAEKGDSLQRKQSEKKKTLRRHPATITSSNYNDSRQQSADKAWLVKKKYFQQTNVI